MHIYFSSSVRLPDRTEVELFAGTFCIKCSAVPILTHRGDQCVYGIPTRLPDYCTCIVHARRRWSYISARAYVFLTGSRASRRYILHSMHRCTHFDHIVVTNACAAYPLGSPTIAHGLYTLGDGGHIFQLERKSSWQEVELLAGTFCRKCTTVPMLTTLW